jgi:nitroreductase
MVRSYDEERPVPPEVVERLVHAALRAPSAGFSQGWGFLVLDTPEGDIDAGFASLLILLTAVDEGLGGCFFGIPVERIGPYREAFGVPDEFHPIGAISVGYSDEAPRDFATHRKPVDEVVHRGRWK